MFPLRPWNYFLPEKRAVPLLFVIFHHRNVSKRQQKTTKLVSAFMKRVMGMISNNDGHKYSLAHESGFTAIRDTSISIEESQRSPSGVGILRPEHWLFWFPCYS